MRSTRYRRFQTMDHPCHCLKVAGMGLKRARYHVRSPVHEKRRGMGSDSEPPWGVGLQVVVTPGRLPTARRRIRGMVANGNYAAPSSPHRRVTLPPADRTGPRTVPSP